MSYFYRGDFEFMDGADQTVNVCAFQKLYEACVYILALKLAKKYRKDLYSRMLWSKLFI